jgi:hypothetical protein
METLELDDDEESEAAESLTETAAATTAIKKDKKLRVPNFERFRWALVLVLLLIPVFIYALYYALAVAPKATITIDTNAISLNADLNLTLNTAAKQVDAEEHVAPAKLVQQQKTFSQQASATGQKNNGERATGKVTISLTDCTSDNVTIPKGTGISSGGLTFITQETAAMSSVKIGGACKNDSFPSVASDTVSVTAQQGGSNYNLPAKSTFKISGYSGASGSNAYALSGGTDNIVKVVSQNDIDQAKEKISTQEATIKQTLANQLKQDDYFAVKATFKAGEPTITTSAKVGDPAESVTVTQAITYTMFGAKERDLIALIKESLERQIDTKKQGIINSGLDDATFNVDNMNDKTAALTLQTVATAGPDLDPEAIKKLAAGQKSGYVKQRLESSPGVTGVNVKLSPFWVSSIPKKTTKITVLISKPAAPTNNKNDN